MPLVEDCLRCVMCATSSGLVVSLTAFAWSLRDLSNVQKSLDEKVGDIVFNTVAAWITGFVAGLSYAIHKNFLTGSNIEATPAK